jgi:hypothetical protein
MSQQTSSTTTRGPIPLTHVDRILPDRRRIGERQVEPAGAADRWGLGMPVAELLVAAARSLGRFVGWAAQR